MKKRHGHITEVITQTMQSLILAAALICLIPLSTAYAATSEQQAAQAALKQNGNAGKVLGVTKEVDSNGQTVYAVKILNDGRVRVVRIAQSP